MIYRFDSRGAFLPKFLGGVFVLFCGILIVCYFIARRANPIMLDEHGHVRGTSAALVAPVAHTK
jgi:hypothetical protein